MAQKERLHRVLTAFAGTVEHQAKARLLRRGKIASGKLVESIDSRVVVYGTGNFSLTFNMEEYAKFVDEGVKGAKSTYPESAKSPYKYTNKQPPAKAFGNWVVKKGLKGTRNKKGQFTSRKSLQYAVARGVYNKGIRATHFFSLPFAMQFKNLPNDITRAFMLNEQDFRIMTQ
jgi:hypothetical protein